MILMPEMWQFTLCIAINQGGSMVLEVCTANVNSSEFCVTIDYRVSILISHTTSLERSNNTSHHPPAMSQAEQTAGPQTRQTVEPQLRSKVWPKR